MTQEPSDWSQPTDYERWYESSLGRAYAASLERTLRPWLEGTGDLLVADVGCGPGLTMERFFPAEARIIGMDCSWEMARRAAAVSRQAADSREIVVGSAERTPFADGTFDLVFCINCLEFVAERAAGFAEFARILRPGGVAILGVLNRRSLWEWTRRLWRPFTRRSYYQGRFFTVEELESECAAAGLAVEEIATAVHFPPVRPGFMSRAYELLDRRARKRGGKSGAVILCRARKLKV